MCDNDCDGDGDELDPLCEEDYSRAGRNHYAYIRLCVKQRKTFQAILNELCSDSDSVTSEQDSAIIISIHPSPTNQSHEYPDNQQSTIENVQPSDPTIADVYPKPVQDTCFESGHPSTSKCTDVFMQTPIQLKSFESVQPSTSTCDDVPCVQTQNNNNNADANTQSGEGRVSRVGSEISSREIPTFNATEFR